MPELRPAEGMGTKGAIDESSILVGEWPYIGIVDGAAEYELGNAPDCQLEVNREDFQFVTTAWPKTVALTVMTSIGMRFSGNLNEMHKVNLHILAGDAANDASNYIYIGARRDCRFVTFSAKRERVCDGRTLEVYMWKVLASGVMQIGTGEPVATPFEFNALSDEGGDYGGSATAPLGYIYTYDFES